MTAPVCHYLHRDLPWIADRDRGPYNPDPPALVAILNGHGRAIAYRCPVCLRAWGAELGGIGLKGHELAPVDAGKRRARMIEALNGDDHALYRT